MLQWDLTDTPLAGDDGGTPPHDGELLALMVALMFNDGVGYAELQHRSLSLTEENLEAVARVVESRLAVLARDIGVGDDLRQRLKELTGIRVSRQCFGLPLGGI